MRAASLAASLSGKGEGVSLFDVEEEIGLTVDFVEEVERCESALAKDSMEIMESVSESTVLEVSGDMELGSWVEGGGA